MILRVEGRGLETSSCVCGGFWKELGCHVGHVADGDGVSPPPPHSDSWEGQVSESVWVARGLPAGHPGGRVLLKE